MRWRANCNDRQLKEVTHLGLKNVCDLPRYIRYIPVFQNLNTKVIFDVRLTTGGIFNGEDIWGEEKRDAQIPFNISIVNLSNGFDLGNSMFVTPVSGVYKFSFSGQISKRCDNCPLGNAKIKVKKNGEEILVIVDNKLTKREISQRKNISYVWMMVLQKDDEISIHSDWALWASDSFPLTFTGELIYKQ